MFRVQHLPDNEEVFECLEEKVIRVLVNLPDLETDKVKIKISGDMTCMGKCIHVSNYAFAMYTDNWKSVTKITK